MLKASLQSAFPLHISKVAIFNERHGNATCNTNTVWTHLLCEAEFHEMKTSQIVLFGPERRPLTCTPHY